MTTMSALTQTFFLNRVRALQWLCSETDPDCPKALLFVPGVDGRHNASSVQVLKYLFKGSVGKELLDDSLEDELESLEDIVLLVKEGSVSVMYSETMKKLVYPVLSGVPRLVEYLYTAEEEADIDQFQLRKCVNFKRMILDELLPGDCVGIPVPVAYDDIMEVEGWPLLQSFALDSVYGPTGFFTARHTVSDITTQVDALFRAVDSFALDHALHTLSSTVLPHAQEMLLSLDAPTTAQRERITADEAIGPLDVLYDFGELHAVSPADSAPRELSRPLFLVGAHTKYLGNTAFTGSSDWRAATLRSDAVLAVVEGCEPSTGLRWCRSLFFAHHSSDSLSAENLLTEIERIQSALSSSESEGKGTDEEEEEEKAGSEGKDSDEQRELLRVRNRKRESSDAHVFVSRLQKLYVQLWLTLRRVVCDVFLSHHDVLDAGTEIQNRLFNAFSADAHASEQKVFGEWLSLLPREHLQIHMDCMDALGNVVSVDDVDELGGACWMYIRVSIQNVSLGANESGAVAVGDTFLFSPLAKASQRPNGGALTPSQLSDCVCITQRVPYFRALVGAGVEDEHHLLMHYCSAHSLTLSPLGVGRSLSVSLNLPVLFDHALVRHGEASVRLFTQGLVLYALHGLRSPSLCVSLSQHVHTVTSVDLREAARHALSLVGAPLNALTQQVWENEEVPEGVLLVFSLKSLSSQRSQRAHTSLTALSHVLPLCEESESMCESVALCVLRDDAAHASVYEALGMHWRAAMNAHDVCERRDVRALSPSLCASLVHWLDHTLTETRAHTVFDTHKNVLTEGERETCAEVVQRACDYESVRTFPGEGVVSMRCVHALSDARRFSPSADFESLLFPESDNDTDRDRNAHVDTDADTEREVRTVVVAGVAGSGVLTFATQLTQQLRTACLAHNAEHALTTTHPVLSTEVVQLDLTHTSSNTSSSAAANTSLANKVVAEKIQHALRARRFCTKPSPDAERRRECVLLCVVCVVSPHCAGDFHSTLSHIASLSNSRVAHVTVVVSPTHLFANAEASEAADLCVGTERALAVGREMLSASCCDAVVALDALTHSHNARTQSAYNALRHHLRGANAAAALLRVSLSLPLCEELVQQIISAVTQGIKSLVLSERESAAVLQGLPQPLSHTDTEADTEAELTHSPVVCVRRESPEARAWLSVWRATPHTTCAQNPQWSLSSVMRTLTYLFPHAQLVAPALTQRWYTAPSHNVHSQSQRKGAWSRLWQLATHKTLTQRHAEMLAQECERNWRSVCEKRESDFSALRAGLQSVHGVLFTAHETLAQHTHNPQTQTMGLHTLCVVIEANAGCVSVREVKDASSSGNAADSHLVFGGSLSAQSTQLLHSLVQVCEDLPLPQKPRLCARVEWSEEERRAEVQAMPRFAQRALPQGWWFDGKFFADHTGARFQLRPDVWTLCEELEREENEKIERFNAWVEEVNATRRDM